jgi:uncharacterized protein (DUF433 family)
MRIPASLILKLLAGGTLAADILADYPDLEQADIDQCIEYAVALVDEKTVIRTS